MILIDATPLQSEHRLRGVGAYLRQLIVALEDVGELKPHYLVSTVGLKHAEFLPPEQRVPVFRGHRPAQVYWLYNELAFGYALRKERPAVFFAPDFNGLVSNPYGKTVAVLHDLTALKLAAQRSLSPSQLLSDLRWRAYLGKLKRADRILAVSENAKRDAVALLGIDSEKIGVVHHGLDHSRFKPSRGCGRFAAAGPYLVHLGGRNDNKNQTRILAAFARIAASHPALQLFFAGPWRGADHAWLEERTAHFGLQGRVRHLGYTPETDLPSLYGNAAAFVFPSLEEGFGLPVLEAMACGAPVITSDCSALPEVAGGAALLVDPYSVEALGAALTRLLENPAYQEILRAQGFRRAAHFTWQRTAQGTLTFLQADR